LFLFLHFFQEARVSTPNAQPTFSEQFLRGFSSIKKAAMTTDNFPKKCLQNFINERQFIKYKGI